MGGTIVQLSLMNHGSNSETSGMGNRIPTKSCLSSAYCNCEVNIKPGHRQISTMELGHLGVDSISMRGNVQRQQFTSLLQALQ